MRQVSDKINNIERRLRSAAPGPYRMHGDLILDARDNAVAMLFRDHVRADRNEALFLNLHADHEALLVRISNLEQDVSDLENADCEECVARENDDDRDELEARIARYETALRQIADGCKHPHNVAKDAR